MFRALDLFIYVYLFQWNCEKDNPSINLSTYVTITNVMKILES